MELREGIWEDGLDLLSLNIFMCPREGSCLLIQNHISGLVVQAILWGHKEDQDVIKVD